MSSFLLGLAYYSLVKGYIYTEVHASMGLLFWVGTKGRIFDLIFTTKTRVRPLKRLTALKQGGHYIRFLYRFKLRSCDRRLDERFLFIWIASDGCVQPIAGQIMINPFSHSSCRVSHLTAVGHMRSALKRWQIFLKGHLLKSKNHKIIRQPQLILTFFLHFMFFLAICLKKG